MAGESGTPLHLKIKAYHVDLVRNEVERPGLKVEDIGSMVVPRQSYIKRIDADCTWPFKEEERDEVKAKDVLASGAASGRYVSIRIWWLLSPARSTKYPTKSARRCRRYARRPIQSEALLVCKGNR